MWSRFTLINISSIFNFVYRSGELRKEYDALMIEKAELKRSISGKQQKVKTFLADIKTLYQVLNPPELKSNNLTLQHIVRYVNGSVTKISQC